MAGAIFVVGAGCGAHNDRSSGAEVTNAPTTHILGAKTVERDLNELIGMRLPDAETRLRSSGVSVRVVEGDVMTADRHRNRVTLKVERGVVVDAWRG